MVALSTENLFCRPEPPRPSSNAYAAQKSDIKFSVDPTVVVSACRGDTPLPLEHANVLGRNP
jgi:hypothetical protein